MPRPRKINPTDYKNQFQRERYDRIAVQVKKGVRDEIRQHADNRGESLNGFINRAIKAAIERDSGLDL